MAFHNVIIVGGTGSLGKLITESFLDKKKFQVTLLNRPDSQKKDIVNELKGKGAHIVEASLEDFEQLKNALKGFDLVVSVVSGAGFGQQVSLIKAAKAAGVKRFIPSEFGVDIEKATHIDFLQAKRDALQELKKQNLEYVAVHTGFFLEYLLSPWFGFDFANSKATFGGDGTQKFPTTHTRDIARLFPDIVTHPNSANKTVNLYGIQVSVNEIVQELEKATGKKWEKIGLSVDAVEKKISDEQDPFKKFPLQLHLMIARDQLADEANYQEFTKEQPQFTVKQGIESVLKH